MIFEFFKHLDFILEFVLNVEIIDIKWHRFQMVFIICKRFFNCFRLLVISLNILKIHQEM